MFDSGSWWQDYSKKPAKERKDTHKKEKNPLK